MAINLSDAHATAVRSHAEATYPHECCGILLGRTVSGVRQVEEVVRMRNANTTTPHNRFDFDPKEHLQVQRGARERGLEVVGFYHSHPDHPARPSQYDLDNASWPGYSYIIVAVARGVAQELNAFELAENRSHFIQEAVLATNRVGSV
ncbi:MAG: M67 family metallopeptidase [Terriglobales bacterium]